VHPTGTLDAATWGAELARGDGTAHIYIVEPSGPIEDDPNLTDKKFGGGLATNAAWRAEVVPSPPPESPETAKARRAKRLTRHPRMRLVGERPSWSDPLQRVFRVDGFACPGCGGAFALRCVVVNPPATRRILDGLRPPGRRAPTGRAEGVTTGRVRSGDVGMRGSFFQSVAVVIPIARSRESIAP